MGLARLGLAMLWCLSVFLFLQGARLLAGELRAGERIFRLSRERAELGRVRALLTELEETLCVGLAPDASRFAALRELPAPWGTLAYDSLQELRSRGGALLPTLRRLRVLAEAHSAALADSRAKSAQSLAQAAACAVLAPALGAVLAWLLPGVREHVAAWSAACALAFSATGTGALWMLGQAENARWGGLAREKRAWVLAALCGGERFLALVRAGTPADTAWARACELLAREAPGLAELWGHSVWAEDPGAEDAARPPGATASLAEAGRAIRKAVQVSLMEGRPCAERVESALQALRSEIQAWVDRELALLGTRSLKPLFLCVAPALLGLMAFGLYLGAGAMLLEG